ncbi:hypothetical protein [Streptomyces sp. NPDC007905]|uniref:hypothetical protein n=1 Tax=Streptomyces sp. NPDC007905 TaxID=3364788 RepID=UPI0036E2E89A
MTTGLRTTMRALRRAVPAGAVATAAGLPLLCSVPARATSERLTDVDVYAYCQRWGDRVADGPSYNHYWAEIVSPQGRLGWVSAVYVGGGSNDGPVPGVPVETDTSPVHREYP